MTGEVINHGTINVAGNLVVTPDAVADLREFLQQEAERGVDPEAMEDIGHPPVEADIPDEQPTDAEKAEAGEALAQIVIRNERARARLRKRALEGVIKEVDRSRKMGGFLVNHEVDPDDPETVAKIHDEEWEKAEKSLELACANCHFGREGEEGGAAIKCKLKENLEGWLDVHSYKNSNKMRPGGKYVRKRESRMHFGGTALREDPDAHCDPAVRPQARRKLLKEKAA